jgi:hypothetical protein
MRKIPCLFQRDFTDRTKITLLPEVTPGCEWVLSGEGIATRKWDGTACAIIYGILFARYDAKRGKPAPLNGIACDEPDPVTGHHPHWVPATGPEHKYINEAFLSQPSWPDGTYEACGPKINGNHEGFSNHILIRHGADPIIGWVRNQKAIRDFLIEEPMEGLVFHHPDGRMCKIRRNDFGLPWPNPTT